MLGLNYKATWSGILCKEYHFKYSLITICIMKSPNFSLLKMEHVLTSCTEESETLHCIYWGLQNCRDSDFCSLSALTLISALCMTTFFPNNSSVSSWSKIFCFLRTSFCVFCCSALSDAVLKDYLKKQVGFLFLLAVFCLWLKASECQPQENTFMGANFSKSPIEDLVLISEW